jgi:hypothetical protein
LGVNALIPAAGQIDALIAAGLGPLQLNIGLQLNAAFAASASLAIQVGDPFAALEALLASLASIQVALSAALAFPIPSVQISAQLSASMALQGTLSVQLGALQQAIQLALAVKIPALAAIASLTAAMNASVFAFTFDSDTLAATGDEIAGLFSTGLVDGANVVLPTDTVLGIVMLSPEPSASAAFDVLFSV